MASVLYECLVCGAQPTDEEELKTHVLLRGHHVFFELSERKGD